MENPPFWWYDYQEKMDIFYGELLVYRVSRIPTCPAPNITTGPLPTCTLGHFGSGISEFNDCPSTPKSSTKHTVNRWICKYNNVAYLYTYIYIYIQTSLIRNWIDSIFGSPPKKTNRLIYLKSWFLAGTYVEPQLLEVFSQQSNSVQCSPVPNPNHYQLDKIHSKAPGIFVTLFVVRSLAV